MRLTIDDAPSRLERIGAAIPRVMLAVVFLAVGGSKFGDGSSWIGIFDQIGWGQWLRYLAGGMQLSGAVLLLIRRTAPIGAALIACTMVGACCFDLAKLGMGVMAVIPFGLLAAAVGVGMQSYFNR